MKPTEIIRKGYLTNFISLLICIFLFFTAVSSIYLYFDIYRPLGTHYSAVLSIVTELKETLILRSIKINAIFFLFIMAGISILGILYTHMIAGPLYRIKLFSKEVSEGRLDTRVNFRRKDAIHSFADSLNKMTESCNDRVITLNSELQTLKSSVAELKSRIDAGEDTDIALKRVLEQDSKIEGLLSTVRL